jgi:hypothetical protein
MKSRIISGMLALARSLNRERRHESDREMRSARSGDVPLADQTAITSAAVFFV